MVKFEQVEFCWSADVGVAVRVFTVVASMEQRANMYLFTWTCTR